MRVVLMEYDGRDMLRLHMLKHAQSHRWTRTYTIISVVVVVVVRVTSLS